jgi:cyclopropane fatty-acyl-phospholipid synthase-like methyltransferase
MTNHPVQALYTRKAKLYQRFFVDFLQWEKVLETFYQENNYLHPGMKILDAGCGTGSVTRALYHLARYQKLEGITFYGFDLTPAMLDLFKERMNKEGMHDIHLRSADVLDLENQLPRDWTGYDLIVSSAMLEYIPKEKLSQALVNLKRLLREKGRMLLFVTRRTWITKWAGAKWWGANLFDLDELEMNLQQAGLTPPQIMKLPAFWDAYLTAIDVSASL